MAAIPTEAPGGALIDLREESAPAPPRRSVERAALAFVVLATVAVFAPTLRNGYLLILFDDPLFLDNPDVRRWGWSHALNLVTRFNEANYIPLTLLSFALQERLFGLTPFGCHLVNVLLHGLNAGLAWVLFRPLTRCPWTATLAALVFALHPLQMEAVSTAIQRKTLLGAALYFTALILYRRWRTVGGRAAYAGALAAAVGAAAAKPVAVTLPGALLLYEFCFVARRVRILDKVPFFAVSAFFSWAAVEASRAVGAVKMPHGGSWYAHLLIVARTTLEYVAALFLPLNLSPLYCYPPGILSSPLNLLSVAALLVVLGFATLGFSRYGWSFFCVWWFVITLLPQSNLVPVAQLRPDRYLYLSMPGFGLWVAIALRHWERQSGRAWPARLVGASFVAFLAFLTVLSAEVWRSDISAWTAVRERSPWFWFPHHNLGVAYADAGLPRAAERSLQEAIRLDPDQPPPHMALARLYARQGNPAAAIAEVRRVLELKPGHEEGARLLRELERRSAGEQIGAAP